MSLAGATSSAGTADDTPATSSWRGASVLYLVYRESLNPVFESMVGRPLITLRENGVPIDLCVITPVGHMIRPKLRRRINVAMGALRARFDGRVSLLPSPPSRYRAMWDEAKQLRRHVRKHYADDQRLIIHCRGPEATNLACDVRDARPNTRVIYDVRGINFAEHLYEFGYMDLDAAPADVASHIRAMCEGEQKAATRADHLLCVSRAMADFLCDAWRVPRDRLDVVWNHVPPAMYDSAVLARDATRRSLGVADRFVVGYCGSVYRRQRAEQGVRLFNAIRDIEPSAYYLALTQNGDQLRRLLDDQGIGTDHVRVMTVPHHETPRYLAAMDVGLITTGLFEPACLANRVCCPVKFAEYLAAGVPVIMSENIGDYSDMVAEAHLGVSLSDTADGAAVNGRLKDLVASCRSDRAAWRDRCRDIASGRLASAAHLSTVTTTYRRVAEAMPTDQDSEQ